MNRIVAAVATTAVIGSSVGVGVAWADSHHDSTHSTTPTPGPAPAVHHGSGTVPFGPTSYDGLRLGMDAAQIRAAGGSAGRPTPEVCAPVTLPGRAVRRSVSEGSLSKEAGLAYLVTTDPRATTPEGIHIGSTRAQVEAAYPRAQKAPAYWFVTVPGHPSVWYMWGYRHGRVSGLTMELPRHACAG
ncbi:MAG TPA: hypothetical protein VF426_01010 [Marmoricola sp.]